MLKTKEGNQELDAERLKRIAFLPILFHWVEACYKRTPKHLSFFLGVELQEFVDGVGIPIVLFLQMKNRETEGEKIVEFEDCLPHEWILETLTMKFSVADYIGTGQKFDARAAAAKAICEMALRGRVTLDPSEVGLSENAGLRYDFSRVGSKNAFATSAILTASDLMEFLRVKSLSNEKGAREHDEEQ